MTRTALLAATASLLFAGPPALADGKDDKKLTGLGEVGWDTTGYDLDWTANDLDTNMFHGAGSALWTWPSKLNVQGNYGFASNRGEFDNGNELVVDTWKIGGGVFYRDPAEGSIGAEVHYQSLDIVEYADGLTLMGRGEKFLKQASVGAYIGYANFDDDSFEADGWQLGAYGKYYVEPNFGLKAGLDYSSYDVDGNDADDLSLNGEAEYLIPDCTTSIYAGLGYGTIDWDNADIDYWRFGLGLRVHFGTEGSLIQRNRVEPLPALGHLPFAL